MTRLTQSFTPAASDGSPSEFGRLLRKFRQRAGLSQEVLAERSGVSLQAVSALERGVRRTPYRDTVRMLADALGLAAVDRSALQTAASRRRSTLESPRGYLPLQPTAFFGREREVAEVKDLLANRRVVTIVGPPGIGKTRTSLRIGDVETAKYEDGVWFVELAPLRDAQLVPSAIAATLGIALSGNGDATQALTAALKPKHLLLILDNCEHLIDAAASVVAAVVRICPRVAVVATSRQRLGVAGETAYRIPPLDVPSANELENLGRAEAERYAAIALFTERAESADTRFALTDLNASSVADIVRRLDGIPLAIELAAARVSALSLEQLRERLDERFRLLASNRRDAVPRQQTLKATIDWSYDLLSEEERLLFRRLGIFAGSFSLGAVTAVCGEGTDSFEVLASLVDKSLVAFSSDGPSNHYRLLQSMRDYALALVRATDEFARLADGHLRYFRELAEHAEAEYEATINRAGSAELSSQLEDVRAALAWALEGGDVLAGAALVAATARMWHRLGRSGEGLALLERFLPQAPADDARLLSRLWNATALLAVYASTTARAFEAAERAVAFARSAQDTTALIEALSRFATAAARRRHLDSGDTSLQEAERLAETAATPLQRSGLLDIRDFYTLLRGDFDAAAIAYEAQRERHLLAGDEFGVARATQVLAEAEHARGQTRHAIELSEELLDRHNPALRTVSSNLLVNLTGYYVAIGDHDAARSTAARALELLAAGDAKSPHIPIVLEHLALSLASQGHWSRGARVLGYCEAALGRIGFERELTEKLAHERLTTLLRDYYSETQATALAAEGTEFTVDRAVEEAMLG